MELMSQAQILDEAVCISLGANTFGKGMNPSVLPPAMSEEQDRLGSFALVRQPGEEKL